MPLTTTTALRERMVRGCCSPAGCAFLSGVYLDSNGQVSSRLCCSVVDPASGHNAEGDGCVAPLGYCQRGLALVPQSRLPVLQGFGVYRFAKKYGANVDGYSPIYTPDSWSESGDQYSLGTKGLIAW